MTSSTEALPAVILSLRDDSCSRRPRIRNKWATCKKMKGVVVEYIADIACTGSTCILSALALLAMLGADIREMSVAVAECVRDVCDSALPFSWEPAGEAPLEAYGSLQPLSTVSVLTPVLSTVLLSPWRYRYGLSESCCLELALGWSLRLGSNCAPGNCPSLVRCSA